MSTTDDRDTVASLRSVGFEIELQDGKLTVEMPPHVTEEMAQVLRRELLLQRDELIRELEAERA